MSLPSLSPWSWLPLRLNIYDGLASHYVPAGYGGGWRHAGCFRGRHPRGHWNHLDPSGGGKTWCLANNGGMHRSWVNVEA